MSHDWLTDALHGVGDAVADLTREWRIAHRFAAIFGLFFVVGVIFLGVAAFEARPFPGARRFYGSWILVSGLAACLCYRLGRRQGRS